MMEVQLASHNFNPQHEKEKKGETEKRKKERKKKWQGEMKEKKVLTKYTCDLGNNPPGMEIWEPAQSTNAETSDNLCWGLNKNSLHVCFCFFMSLVLIICKLAE